MLGPLDPLPHSPRRVLVAGVSGAGKSTLAARLSRILRLPYTELDSLYHGPAWTPIETFEADVEALTRGDRWVIEWQYTQVKGLLADRADTLVWLDLPYRTTLRQVTRRTVRRRLRREPLWNDNAEGSLLRFFFDPDQIIRWSIGTRHSLDDLPDLVATEYPHLQVVRLRSRRQVEQFVFAAGTHRTDALLD